MLPCLPHHLGQRGPDAKSAKCATAAVEIFEQVFWGRLQTFFALHFSGVPASSSHILIKYYVLLTLMRPTNAK